MNPFDRPNPERRGDDLKDFYRILGKLEDLTNGARRLKDCNGRLTWPERGVYFFMEPGELRTGTGQGPRIVRVGTHALREGSRTALWTRLSQHKGQAKTGGGNHRGSIFRLIVGTALDADHAFPSWGQGSMANGVVRRAEEQLEQKVSRIIGDMPFLWLAVTDAPNPQSLRGYIERNAIALLSNFMKPPIDTPSRTWLGYSCDRERVRVSGLWNQNHVEQAYQPGFLKVFEGLADEMRTA